MRKRMARPPVQIVLPYPPDPIMGGPIVPIPERSADPARDVNIEPVERLNRLTSIGQLEKQLNLRS
jgi:hypothetical protein